MENNTIEVSVEYLESLKASLILATDFLSFFISYKDCDKTRSKGHEFMRSLCVTKLIEPAPLKPK